MVVTGRVVGGDVVVVVMGGGCVVVGSSALDREHLAVGEPAALLHYVDLPQTRWRRLDVEARVAILIDALS